MVQGQTMANSLSLESSSNVIAEKAALNPRLTSSGDLSHNKLTSLPESIWEVGGDVRLNNNYLTSLPENMHGIRSTKGGWGPGLVKKQPFRPLVHQS